MRKTREGMIAWRVILDDGCDLCGRVGLIGVCFRTPTWQFAVICAECLSMGSAEVVRVSVEVVSSSKSRTGGTN